MTRTAPAIEAQKAGLRETASARRAALAASERAEASAMAAAHFLREVPVNAGEAVALYWPIRDEIDCKPVLVALMDRECRVCLPAVVDQDAPLEMRLWEKDESLYPSGFGTLAPAETAPRVRPDVVVVPLLGFDRRGNRLGYGKGHYDRTLAAMDKAPLLVGYAFSVQELEAIPAEPHDVRLDLMVTEAGVRRFGRDGSAA